MAEGPVDAVGQEVVRSLTAKVNELSSMSSSSQFLFKVPRQLRQAYASNFEPQLITIGPYHRGKIFLRGAEIYKVRYFEKLVRRGQISDGSILNRIVDCCKSNEASARSCYADTVSMTSKEFVEMLVLDGCFVVDLILKFMIPTLRDDNDALFKQNVNLTIVAHDLLLLENQLPFFVLDMLFEHIKTITQVQNSFAGMALQFFSGIMPGTGLRPDLVHKDIKHLLGLVDDNWLPSPEGLKRHKQQASTATFMRSTSELVEVGIRFMKGKGNSLFDIKFDKGTLYIPTLTINHNTERIFRNLIAYEQFNPGLNIVMDYTKLMNCLTNHAGDVALLSECGVIDNWLGSNEAVANMFNKFNDYVSILTANFYYSDVFADVNEHYEKYTWKLKLKTKNSQAPWDWILVSITAATILLLLTVTQTIVAILDYLK